MSIEQVESVVFCPHCRNILSPAKHDNDLVYTCRLCNYVEKAKVKNYRISYMSKETMVREVDNVADIIEDPTLPRIEKKCTASKCKSNVAVYIVEPKSLKKRYYCILCNQIM
jgi:DNA-directed RNA polymerase subunit M/transcription elongation factor TFIIS